MISRSLGPEFGGSIGIIFSCANAVAAAMYMVGFAESVRDLMKVIRSKIERIKELRRSFLIQSFNSKIIDSSINDIRIIALCTAVVLLGVVLIGIRFETKVKLF